MLHADAAMRAALAAREKRGLRRRLTLGRDMVDFSSNDYLGLARSSALRQAIKEEEEEAVARTTKGCAVLGSSGSRLLSGNSTYMMEVEEEVAGYHNREAALFFNSGYAANLAVASCLPNTGDFVVYDELCHNSLREGMRLGRQRGSKPAKHNCLASLNSLLEETVPLLSPGNTVYVFVESLYSMEGDQAPLDGILAAAEKHWPAVSVVVDEAHATGTIGPGGSGVAAMLGVERHPCLLCTVHTYGKALGVHGAAVCGSNLLKSYLLNYARSLIYTTAMPLHSVAGIRCSYRMVRRTGDALRRRLEGLISLFLSGLPAQHLLPSLSPIQAVVFPTPSLVVAAAEEIRSKGFDVLPIRAPTVPPGKERLRIIIHAHNTEEQILQLTTLLRKMLDKQGSSKL